MEGADTANATNPPAQDPAAAGAPAAAPGGGAEQLNIKVKA